MPTVAVVASEGALRAVRVVVLGFSVAVVEHEHEPPAKRGRHRLEPRGEGRTPFGFVAGPPEGTPEATLDGLDVAQEGRPRRPGHPAKATVRAEVDVHRLQPVGRPPESLHRQGVGHFVREHDPVEALLGERIQPLDPEVGEAVPLPVPQVGARLEDAVAARAAAALRELREAALGECPRPAPQLEDLSAAEEGEDRLELPGDRASEQRGDFGGGDEVALRAELAGPRRVVSEPGCGETDLHVFTERNRSRRLYPSPDEVRGPAAVAHGVGIGSGQPVRPEQVAHRGVRRFRDAPPPLR